MKLTLRPINHQTIIIHVTNCIAFVTDVQELEAATILERQKVHTTNVAWTLFASIYLSGYLSVTNCIAFVTDMQALLQKLPLLCCTNL